MSGATHPAYGFLRGPIGGALTTGLVGAALLVHGLWIPAKAALAQVLLERAWRRALAGETRPRPWPWADTWPIARLLLPAEEPDGEPVDLVVLAGASGRTLAFAPGHLDGSARPGEDGNVVLAGHRDTHFRALDRLAPGDEVVLEFPAAGAAASDPAVRRRYRVAAARVADKSRTDLLADTAVPTLTLVTCWPFDAVVPGGPLRYVVSARLASGPDAQNPLPLHRQLLPKPDGGGVGAGAQGG